MTFQMKADATARSRRSSRDDHDLRQVRSMISKRSSSIQPKDRFAVVDYNTACPGLRGHAPRQMTLPAAPSRSAA